jgi:plastocyanin
MRFTGLALFASAIVLGACRGGDSSTADTTATTTGSDTSAAPAGQTGQAAPITGTTHTVRMLGDDKGYRFEPANLTVKQGDGVRFLMVSGGPHNVAFDPAAIPANAKDQLKANMTNQESGELSSKMYMNPDDGFTMSFAGVPAGQYPYVCTPHLAMNMRGVITVQ